MAGVFEAVDDYINSLFVPDDPALAAALVRADAAGLPPHAVSPGQGKLIYLLAKMIGAKRVVELGALGGYSTIWLGRALGAGGSLTSIELNPDHAAIARESIAEAGLSEACEIVEGRALDVLKTLSGPIDVMFLDANKDSYPAYLSQAVRLVRPGGLILADNVVREGDVLAPKGVDASAIGAAAFNQALAEHPQLEAIILQQVGAKGHDGLAIARVKNT